MVELSLQEQDGMVVLKVRAAPNASRTRIVGQHGDALKVAVTAAPEHGKANAALVQVLAEALQLPQTQITVLQGSASRDKRIGLRGIDVSTLRQRLAHWLSR